MEDKGKKVIKVVCEEEAVEFSHEGYVALIGPSVLAPRDWEAY